MTRIGKATIAQPDHSKLFENLESRVLLTAFVYKDLSSLVDTTTPVHVLRPYGDRASVHTVGTSVAGIGDVNGDGTPDILVGAAGLSNSKNHESSLAAVFSGATGELLYGVTDGFREFGASVAGLGDINGDGVPDFAVGSPRYNTEGRNNPAYHHGAAYIFSGADGTLLRSIFHDQIVTSERNGDGWKNRGDRFGDSVALAGDVNNDGVPDVIIGAPGVDGAGADRGAAYVYSGSDGALLATFEGPADGYRLGAAVSTAGDIDADGHADLLVGAPGSPTGKIKVPGHVYVYSGADSSVLRTFTGTAPRDLFGFSVASGDLDNDSVPDIVIGSPGRQASDGWGDDDHDDSDGGDDDNDDNSGSGGGDDDSIDWDDEDCDQYLHNHAPFAGRTFFYSGADGSELYVLRGEGTENMGAAVAVAGDVNFDGHADVLIGSPARKPEGRALLVSGLDGSTLIAFSGKSSPLVDSDRLGTSVAAVGDVNGDGITDFAFGATQDSNFLRNDRGRVYVMSGVGAVTLIPEGINDDDDIWGTAGHSEFAPAFLISDGELFMLPSRGGFETGDHVIDVNLDGTVLGVDKDGAPFLWTDGTRTLLSDQITTFTGDDGLFDESFRAVDLTDSGLVLIERLRDGTERTAWLAEGDTATFLADGMPVAMNEARTVIIVVLSDVTDVPAKTLVWSPDADPIEIENFTAAGLNAEGVLTGVLVDSSDPSLLSAVTWRDGNFTMIGEIEGGSGFEPTGINDDGMVVGTYTTAEGEVSGFFYSPEQPIADIKELVKVGGTGAFFDSADIGLLGINNKSKVVGLNNDARTGFLLEGFEGPGPFDGKDLDVANAHDADGDLHVMSINRAGEVILMTKSAETGEWTALDFAELLGAPAALQVVGWTDADGNAVFAAASHDGLLLFTQVDGGWWMRNLTTEFDGATPIVSGLVTFTDNDGFAHVGGMDVNGDIVTYTQTGETNDAGMPIWEYHNISTEDLESLGLATPIFTGKLIAYVTQWNGLNIAGLDPDGNLQVVWISPGMKRWVVSNLTEMTNGSARAGGLSVYQTAWGGINFVGVDREGHAVVSWWVPVFGSFWRNDDLTVITGGENFQTDSMTAYTTAWGALTVAGLDTHGRMNVYWWTPGMSSWVASPIDLTSIDDDSDKQRGKPRGLSSHAGPDGSTNIYWTNTSGKIKRLHWKPGQSWWQVETTTPDA